jgi:hypothetical protein
LIIYPAFEGTFHAQEATDARLPIADYDLQVIVLCQEAYASSLAAATLQELGMHRATDVIGGYAACRDLWGGAIPATP